MNFKIKKSDFLSLLRWSQGIVEKRGTMPILSNIFLEAQPGLLRLSATDLEVALVIEGKAEVKSAGKAVVHARNLFEIVREAPDESIHISLRSDHGLDVASGKAKFRIVGMNPQEFPVLPGVSAKNEVLINAQEMEDMIEKTYYAASTDETRYTLNGLHLVYVQKGSQSLLRLVATDGHRLSYTERATASQLNLGNVAKGIIIPRKGVGELKSLIANGEGELGVSVDERAIQFRRGGVSLTIRLIEGDFPNYEQVVPKKSDKIVSVDRNALMGALKRASIMTSDQSRGVRMSFQSGGIEVSASHPDLGEAREELAVDYKGAAFQVGFNPRFFLDLLSVLEDEKVVLELKDEVSPCVVRSEFDRGFLALVMPMRI